MTTMVSFDISTTSTGYAIYNNGILAFSGVIKVDEKSMYARQMVMIDDLQKLLNQYQPLIVVAEEATPTRNAKVMRSLAMVCGSVMGWCAENQAEFVLYKPAEWRKLVCDEGETAPFRRADAKAWAVKKVLEIYGLEVCDDEAEAILIGQARINQFNPITIKNV